MSFFGHREDENEQLLVDTDMPSSRPFYSKKTSIIYGSMEEFNEDNSLYGSDNSEERVEPSKNINWCLISSVFREHRADTIREILSDDRRSSAFLTSINLQTMILGTTILSLPYCIKLSGVWSIAMIVLIGVFANITANRLFDCQHVASSSYPDLVKRVHTTFVGICKASMKTYGQYITEIMVYLNLLRSVVVLILLSDLTSDILARHGVHNYDKNILPVCWTVLLMPPIFITRMSLIAWPSFIGLVSYIVALAAIFVVMCLNYKSWNFSAIKTTTDLQSLGISFGIIVNSFIVHLNIPSIEGSMVNPGHFKRTSNAVFTVNIIIKIVFSVTGFLVFQDDTHQLITANIIGYQPLPLLLKISVLFFTYFSFPGNVFVVFELIDQKFSRYFPMVKPGGIIWLLVSRSLPMLMCLLIAILVPKFGLVLSLTGSLRGSMIVLLLPSLCYLILKWRSGGLVMRLVCILIATVAVVGGVMGMFTSTRALIRNR